MSKAIVAEDEQMRDNYDFSHAIKSPYAELANKRILDRDLSVKFPTSEAVNAALRAYLEIQAAAPR